MTDTTTRCPRCSALLAPEAAWCSLCFLDLRPEPAPEEPEAEPVPEQPEAEPVATTQPPVAAVEGTAAAGSDQAGPPRGRRYRPSAPVPAAAASGDAALPPGVEAMLAQLAAEEGGTKVSLGPLDDAFSTPGRRAGVMAVGALGVTLALFLVMWVLGKLLG